MSKLNQEELLKVVGDSIEEGRRNIRDLKVSLDISQDEFDERMYKLNQADDQVRRMIQRSPEVDGKFIEELRDRIMAIPIREYFTPNKRKIIADRIAEEFTKRGIEIVGR